MLRLVLLPLVLMTACHSTDLEIEDRRTERTLSWVFPGEDVSVSGFVTKNYNDAYGAPFVMVWEGYADFELGKQYAIEEGAFEHRCGDDANITREFALVNTTNDLMIARNFQGVRGFDKIPTGIVRIQALVFADRPCRVSNLEFRAYSAKLANKSPAEKCEEQDGMTWDSNACVKGPKLLCNEKEDFVFVEEKCLPRSAGPAPELLANTAWRQRETDRQWIFQFDEEGSGVFGFKSADLTVQSGKVDAHTDYTLATDHIVVSIGKVEDLPVDASWQEDSLYYCHLRFIAEEPQQMEWNCSSAGEMDLPTVSASVMIFEKISVDETDLDPTEP